MDGHNYIFNLHREENVKDSNIEDLKDQLISDLSAYGTQNEFSIVVVFDAKGSSNSMRSSVIIDDIEVVHSKEGETAEKATSQARLVALESTILAKIQAVEKRIREEENVEELQKLNSVLASLLENLERLKKMKET